MSEFDSKINFEATSRIIGEDNSFRNAKVKVFGVGGAGGNTVNRMKEMNIEGVEYFAVNTDAMALDLSKADVKILIGEKTTKNLGAGMDPEKGRKAAEENIEDIKAAMTGADIVFVAAGMGGGTGTGAAPVVASVARELGILTVAVVTKPFRWEGRAREELALKGIESLRAAVDTIIVVENKKLLALIREKSKNATLDESFKIVDEILGNAVQSICGIMFNHGLIHVDFADIRRVMANGGSALMGTGIAEGEGRGKIAADAALASPLLEDIDVRGATGVLVNVAHGENYSLLEHDDALEYIYEKVGEEGDPNIIVGDITLPEMGDRVSITIIATGCGGTPVARPVPPVMPNVAPQPQMPSGYEAAATVAVPVQTTGVQPATPRPTSTNFVALSGAMPAVAPTVAAPAVPAAEMFTRPATPSVVAPAVQPAVQVAEVPAATTSFDSPAFDTRTSVTEEVVRGSDTAEFSAVAEEDRLNGGRGGVEVPAYNRGNMAEVQSSNETKVDVEDLSVPAYLRGDFLSDSI